MSDPVGTALYQPVKAGIGWRHPHYRELLEQRPELDFLEVHSENFFGNGGAALQVLEQGRAHYPVSLHGVGLSLGSACGLDAWHLDRLALLVDRIDPVRVSDHASFARVQRRQQVVHASDLLPVPFSRESLDVMCANVSRTQDRLKRTIAVENISAYLQWKAAADEPEMSETWFLTTLTQRTGCSLLIDVNNVYVNALNAAKQGQIENPVEFCVRWLEDIKSAPVAELHLAGHCHVNDAWGEIVIDDHGSRVCPEVWDLYRLALQQWGPVPTLIEWDTDIPPLSVLLDEVAQARNAARGTAES